MSTCGARGVPTFDPLDTSTLKRYFEDLEDWFCRASVVNDKTRKGWVLFYAPAKVADLWGLVEEYADQTKTYPEFRAAVFGLYPDFDEGRRWNRTDMNCLVLATFRSGLTTISEWAEFYRDFYAITSYLIAQGRCFRDEQAGSFSTRSATP